MRNLKLQMQQSVDGFVAGINGELEWMTWDWDDELKEYVTTLTEQVDTIVLGRKLAQGFIPYWSGAYKTDPETEGARIFHEAPKIVFTKTLKESDQEVKSWNNTKLAVGDLAEEINKLKKQDGGDIIAYGGGNFVSNLVKEGLIDELHLFVNPVAVGSGMRIFHDLNKMKLVSSKSFSCGIVALYFEPLKK